MDDVNKTAQQNPQQNKDQNVLSFMVQLVQERYGDDTEMDFLNRESDRLYDLFGNNLVSYFEPMLSDQQKVQFDQMVKQGNGGNQEALLGFLVQAIPDLENKIMQVLISFRNAYLMEGQMQKQMQANPAAQANIPNPQNTYPQTVNPNTQSMGVMDGHAMPMAGASAQPVPGYNPEPNNPNNNNGAFQPQAQPPIQPQM